MATTRKPAAKRPRKRSTKAKKKSRLAPIVLGFILAGFTALSIFFFFMRGSFSQAGLQMEVLEGILIAAGINPETDVQMVTREGMERWKIEQISAAKRDNVISALETALLETGKQMTKGKAYPHRGNQVQIIDVPTAGHDLVRLIFVVPAKGTPRKSKPAAQKKPPKVAAQPPKSKPENTATKKQPNSAADTQNKAAQPQVAIILDDIGQRKISRLQPVLDLKMPITFAILPHLTYSASNAIYLYQNHFEVMLHMPMEPDNYPANNPGKGAIFSHLNEGEIQQAIAGALREIPYVTGVNNHMGSKVTANRTLMRTVLAEVKKRNLFFVDSRTKSNSVAFNLAKSMGLATAKRDIFLDAEDDFDFAVGQLKKARQVARKNGLAIVIGHPYPDSLRALVQEMPKMDAEGFQFIFASKAVRHYPGTL